MSAASQRSWAPRADRSLHSVARNVSSRYAAIVGAIAPRRPFAPCGRTARDRADGVAAPVMFMGLVVLADLIPPGTLLAVVLHAAAGAALYVGLFAIAIGRCGRATYTDKARQLLGRPGLAPAA